MADVLTPGGIATVKAGDGNQAVTLQVGSLQPVKPGADKFKARFTDGAAVMEGVLASQVGRRVIDGEIGDLDVLKLTDYMCNELKGAPIVIATAAEVVARGQAPLHAEIGSRPPKDATNAAKVEPASPVTLTPAKAESDASDSTPGPIVRPDSKENAQPMETDAPGDAAAAAPAVTPAPVPKPAAAMRSTVPAHMLQTPGPTPSPSEEVRRSAMGTVKRQPPSPAGSVRKAAQPIAALNPYNTNWTIKARLTNKAPKRSFNRDGVAKSVFSIEVVDDQGTSIEATLWADFADKHYDTLQEGKVYYISRGKVKPANRNYAAVRNDYTINLDNGAAIEECEDADVSKMQARPNFVGIDQLPAFISKKALVDLLGVVSNVGALGSVKRKSDQSELQRRDITLLDQSRKTVVLTMWGGSAEDVAQLEGREAPLLSVTACRVTDFNGVSVSTLQRSQIRVDPDDLPEAQRLRSWYESEGRGAATSAVGEGLANARGGGGGTTRSTLRGIQKEPSELPPPDAKPEYFSVPGTVTFINPDQTMYYMAAPENNRKVTPQNGGYYCEFDGKTYERMERRYVLLVKAADATGETYLNMFNEQAAEVLGMTADALAELKEADDGRFQAALKAALWSQWSFKIQTRTREYNGEVRQRCNVSAMQRLDYAAEAGTMLQEIARLTAAAA